jgi:hypothetical protein
MPKLTFNAADVRQPLSTWPDGPVTASINSAVLETSKNSGEPMIVLELELFHPEHGYNTVKDWLPYAFPAKLAAFFQAFHHLSGEEFRAEVAENEGELEIDDAELVGGTLIVVLGDVENNNGKTYKNIVAPWYFSDERDDVLPADYQSDNPF